METDKQKGPATPQEIWNILKEVSQNQKETDRKFQETDRKLQEAIIEGKRTDQLLQEAIIEGKRTDRQIKQLNDLFHGKWGALVESLVRGDLIKLLNERGIPAGHTLTNLKGDHGKQQFEFDIIAVNGDEVVVVEVKTTLQVKDVDCFLKKMSCFTNFAPEYKGKKIYGAVAYIKAEQSSHINAEKRGLFVIRATGNSAAITNRKEFQPKVF